MATKVKVADKFHAGDTVWEIIGSKRWGLDYKQARILNIVRSGSGPTFLSIESLGGNTYGAHNKKRVVASKANVLTETEYADVREAHEAELQRRIDAKGLEKRRHYGYIRHQLARLGLAVRMSDDDCETFLQVFRTNTDHCLTCGDSLSIYGGVRHLSREQYDHEPVFINDLITA